MDAISDMGGGVGRLIRDLRGGSISQGQLALRAHTSQSYISRLEAGEISPSLDQLERILNCLGYRLRIEPEPLAGRSDPAAYAEQLAMTPEERIRSSAALHNAVIELRAGAHS